MWKATQQRLKKSTKAMSSCLGNVQLLRCGWMGTLVMLSACGGGGSGAPEVNDLSTRGSSPTAVAQQCAPTNPYVSPSQRNGSIQLERRWLQGYMQKTYLWNDEILLAVNEENPAFNDAGNHSQSMEKYFEALLTPAVTASGKRKDAHSFMVSSELWDSAMNSSAMVGFGIEWLMSATNPVVAYVLPESPAANQGVRRGDRLVRLDGIAVEGYSQSQLMDRLQNSNVGAEGRFEWVRPGEASRLTVLAAQSIAEKPVLKTRVFATPENGNVAYLLFNDHTLVAERQLLEAINSFRSQNVRELILDLRYNGGGYGFIANQLSYMIAGPSAQGQVFARYTYNSSSLPRGGVQYFENRSCFYNSQVDNCTTDEPLPALNLRRVYVLTQGSTCSASELIVNSLRGIGVDVRMIGGTTCGKPYGFVGRDNCGITYFPIQFSLANQQYFGSYQDGFSPKELGSSNSAAVTGCQAADDLSQELGDPNEGMLSMALSYLQTGACPATSFTAQMRSKEMRRQLITAWQSIELQPQTLNVTRQQIRSQYYLSPQIR